MNRRSFLSSFAPAIAAGLPLLALGSGCAVTGLNRYGLSLADHRVSLKPSDYPELTVVGGAIELDVGDSSESVVVVRVKEADFIALSPICTHLGCTVSKESATFRCPCHGSTYSLDGRVLRGPAEKPLAAYKTEYDNGTLVIRL
jgi:Rieske Fe-S protein